MHANHTPGPWAFRDCTLVQDTGNRLHLGVFREAPGLGSAAAGNARLIAAAPELLDALQRAEQMLSDWQHTLNARGARVDPLLERARAAISRATGADHA